MNLIQILSHPHLNWKDSLPPVFKGYQLPGSEVYSTSGPFGYLCIQHYRTPDYSITTYMSDLQQVMIFQPSKASNGLHAWLPIDGTCKWQPSPVKSYTLPVFHFTLLGSTSPSPTITLPEKQAVLFEVFFQPHMLQALAGLLPGITKLIADPSQISKPPTPAGAETLNAIRSIVYYAHVPSVRSYYFTKRVEDLLFEYLVSIPGATSDKSSTLSPQEMQMVNEIEAMLNADLSTHVSLDEIAQRVLTSKSTLQRLFKAVHGLPPFEYLMRQRMKLALLLLQSGDTIKHTAVLTGYRPTSFTKAFRKFYGYTASSVRKKQNGLKAISGHQHILSLFLK